MTSVTAVTTVSSVAGNVQTNKSINVINAIVAGDFPDREVIIERIVVTWTSASTSTNVGASAQIRVGGVINPGDSYASRNWTTLNGTTKTRTEWRALPSMRFPFNTAITTTNPLLTLSLVSVVASVFQAHIQVVVRVLPDTKLAILA